MKLSDYIIHFLEERNVNTIFYLPGGGCMHMLDSMGRSEQITAFSLLHEQSATIAAEAYANTTGNIGVVLATTGPGATNTVTGITAAYIDSTPLFILTGQVKTADLKSNYGVRAMGTQEADIVSITQSITKYAAMIKNKNDVRYHLERAWYEAHEGRRGPVLIDVPLDIQGADIDPELIEGYCPSIVYNSVDVSNIIEMINACKRPAIIAGNGVSDCKSEFHELFRSLGMPVIPSWKFMDIIPNDSALYAGRCGGMGDRHGNLTMQNADLLLCFGCRLDFSITGFDRTKWAPNAKKIVVDIDQSEIDKLEAASYIYPYNCDVKILISALLSQTSKLQCSDYSSWLVTIKNWKEKYPIISKCAKDKSDPITTYDFVGVLSRQLAQGAFIAPCVSGTAAEVFYQAFSVKNGQTIRGSHGFGSMGFDIPAAIGMCVAAGYRDTICVAGDGGLQLNIQELAIISQRRLPIKLFVINNQGYASIRNMQNNHFKGYHVGCDTQSGLCLPSFSKLANAYDIAYAMAKSISELESTVENVLLTKGPVIGEIFVQLDCIVIPRTTTIIQPDGSMISTPLENQYPPLPDEEVRENMLA